MTATNQRLWTVHEYYWMEELGILNPEERTELVNGEVMLMAAKRPAHSAITKRATDYLRKLLSGIGDIRIQEPIHLSDNSEPEPDIAVVQIDARDYVDHHPVPSEIFLVIEVADTTLNYDRKKKASAYAKASITDYWVVDVNGEQVYIFRDSEPVTGVYTQKSIMGSSKTVRMLAFPEVEVELGRFFP